MNGNSVDSQAETVFTTDMTTHEPVTMPNLADIRSALNTLDLVICAAEDNKLVSEKTIDELRTAYDNLDHMLRYAR